jgi:hypothetical protein
MSEAPSHPETPSEEPKLRVFISHKAKDSAAAQSIKRLLLRRAKDDRVIVFLSSDAEDIRGGTLWRESIHKNLREADRLVLLYTDPTDRWDWCLYECGYFLGIHPGADTLTVLTPLGVVPPAPLQERHYVKPQAPSISAWLEKFYDPANIFFNGIGTDRDELAKEIAETITPLGSSPYLPHRFFTVHVPVATANTASQDFPDGAFVDLPSDAAGMFGLMANPRMPWPEFLQVAKAVRFDAIALGRSLRDTQNKRVPNTVLPLFKAKDDGKGYRPLIFQVDIHAQGELDSKVVLAPIPPSFDPEKSNGLDRVSNLLMIAKLFRDRVIERNAPAIDALGSTPPPGEWIAVFEAILYDVELVVTEALNLGLDSTEKITDAFEQKDQAELAKLLTNWFAARGMLKSAVEGRIPTDAHEIFTVMRTINYGYMKLASERLAEIMREVRPPDTSRITSPIFRSLIAEVTPADTTSSSLDAGSSGSREVADRTAGSPANPPRGRETHLGASPESTPAPHPGKGGAEPPKLKPFNAEGNGSTQASVSDGRRSE